MKERTKGYMKLTIDNIGIIQKSDIEINGITVITGYNNSGRNLMENIFFMMILRFGMIMNFQTK